MLIVRIRHEENIKKNDKFKKIIRKWYQVRSASGNRRLSTVLLSARSAHSWQRLHHQHYGYLQHFHRHHHSHHQHHRQKTSTQINFAILWKRWGVSKVWALVTKVSFFNSLGLYTVQAPFYGSNRLQKHSCYLQILFSGHNYIVHFIYKVT